MITQLLNTVKEISTVNITQITNPRPIFTCENETIASINSDMITNQSERKRNIDLTSNKSTVTNSEASKVSISEQKNVKDRTRKIGLLKYAIFQELQCQIWNIILFQ